MGLNVSEKIKSLIKNKYFPHTVIIEGEKETVLKLAEDMAKGILCLNSDYFCGECKNCHLADINNHPDLKIISTEKKNYLVEDIRDLRKEAFLTPFIANSRIFIITESEKLSDKCQNSLLKILEEPPKNVYFILLTQNSASFLNTVLSRAVLFSVLNTEESEFDNTVKNIFSLAVNKNRVGILEILSGLKQREEIEKLILKIKDYAIYLLKLKQEQNIGKNLNFNETDIKNTALTKERLYGIIEKLDGIFKVLDFNLNVLLLNCAVCNALT